MGMKCVRQLAAFIVLFTCCAAAADDASKKGPHSVPETQKELHAEVAVPQNRPYSPSQCEDLLKELFNIKTEEKTLKEARGIMLCSEASCMRLSDKFRTYKSTFTLHADLKAKTIELRHVKEEDKELGTPKAIYSFYVNTGEKTEGLSSCFGNKPLKGTVVVQSFDKVPAEDDVHLKFRANVLNLEVVPPVTEKK